MASVPDPTGTSAPTLQFTTYNSDVAPLTPTANPRAQLLTPAVIKKGQTLWESFEVYVPSSFPSIQPGEGWISLETAVYGAPFAGSPAAEIGIDGGDFRFQRDVYAPTPYSIAWSSPLVKDRWVRFTWHFLVARNGWVELYVDGTQVLLNNGSTRVRRLHMPLIDPTDATGPWFSDLQLYYMHNEFPSLTVLFKGFRIATTRSLAG